MRGDQSGRIGPRKFARELAVMGYSNKRGAPYSASCVQACSYHSSLIVMTCRFLQGPGDWRDVEDRRLLDRHGIRRRLARLALVRAIPERPHGCCAAEQRHDVASSHVWMAPAWQEEMQHAAQKSLAVMCPACSEQAAYFQDKQAE
jgi:hypothetical protein